MDREPYEILANIFGFVSDNMGASMTCKTFRVTLQTMHMRKQLLNYSDPYFLHQSHKRYGFKFCSILTRNIKKVLAQIQNNCKNYTCLNYVCFVLFNENVGYVYDYTDMCLLLVFCTIVDYAKPKYILKMIECIKIHPIRLDIFYEKLLSIAFDFKSYEVLKIIMSDAHIKNIWGITLLKRHSDDITIDNAVFEIDFMIENFIVTYDEIINIIIDPEPMGMINGLVYDLELKNKLLEYLEEKKAKCVKNQSK